MSRRYARGLPTVPAVRASAAVLLLSLMVGVLGLPRPGMAAGATRPDLSKVRILAVAPFADEVALSKFLADQGSARLSELLKRGPFQIVDSSRVADALTRLGLTAAELISPTRTVEVGRAVGADAVLTGRVTFVQQERERDDDRLGLTSIESRVDVDIRILEVGTRLILFQDDFVCHVAFLAPAAMECVVRDVASRILPPRN